MGFSTTAAFSILFVFSLIAFGLSYSVVANMAKTYALELREKKERIGSTANTKLEIVNLTTTLSGSQHDLTVVVKNTGTSTLHPEYFDVIIDGLRRNFSYSSSPLYPNTQIAFNVTGISGGVNTTHRLKIVAENGYSIYVEYQVR